MSESLKFPSDTVSEDELTQALIDQLPFAIALFKGPNFIVKNCNSAYKQILGRSDFEGKPFTEAFPEFKNYALQYILSSVFRTGKAFTAKEFKSANINPTSGLEEERFWDFSFTRIADRNSQPYGIYFFGSDVTERVVQTNQLQAAKLESELANATKSNFLANMSHEIRTPLGVIIGFSEMLRDETVDREERRSFLNVINRNANSLTRVIDDILDLSKVEAGKLDIELSRVSLRDVLRDVVTSLGDRAKTVGIELILNIPSEIPQAIQSDAVRLRQIFINIIGNAVKFTEKGSVTITVSMSKNKTNETSFRISVKDTGRGLNLAQKENLFQPFSQADNSTSREFGGTGLGLVLSRRLANALGGDVDIEECEIGKGCTFVVSFTAAVSDEPSELVIAPQPSAITALNLLKGLKILLVEDSRDNQALIERILVKNGASVVIAENGLEGVNHALKENFDLVLMDIQMPKMDGYEAVAKLRSVGYQPPIIALTAHAMTEDYAKTHAAGFCAHVTKPVDFSVLVKTIVEVFRQSDNGSGKLKL